MNSHVSPEVRHDSFHSHRTIGLYFKTIFNIVTLELRFFMDESSSDPTRSIVVIWVKILKLKKL